MGRKPSIDRAKLLDAAEQIISERGTVALSFDAIAKAAGVSKGGVQSAFGSKEELLTALYDHLDSGFAERLDASEVTGASAVDAYVEAVTAAETIVNQRVTALSLAMAQEPESREYLRKWYAEGFPELSAQTEDGRREILRLCALEGAMMLRAMSLLPLQEEDWMQLIEELRR